MTGRRRLSCALSCAVILASVPAGARDPQTVARCTTAAREAQELRARGSLRAAAARLPVCTASECPAVVRRDCGRWASELQDATPTVVFRVVDARGSDVHEGRVLVDDDEAAGGIDGRAVALDPGAHDVAYVHEAIRVEASVVLREGEHARTVILRVPAVNGDAAGSGAGARTPASGASLAPVPPDRDASSSSSPSSPSSSKSSPWPFVLGAVGVVSAGIGAGLWIAGTKVHSDLGSSCAAAHTCSADDVSRGKTDLLLGDALVAVGAVALGVAVVWLVTRSSSSAPPARATARAK